MMNPLTRRKFLQATATGAAGLGIGAELAPAATPSLLIIDTHTHFYNPARPQGVPWPAKDDSSLFRTVLPKDYRAQPTPQSVFATVVVEASPWVEDNQWILDLATKDRFIVGHVGNLPVGTDEFAGHLQRFAANPILRGLRISHSSLQAGLARPRYLADLALLVKHDLELDVNGGPEMLTDVARLARELPGLRIVINHLANVKIDGQAPPAAWRRDLEAAARHKNVFLKVSALVEGTGRLDGTAPREVKFYEPTLDAAWETFGADRLIYGSNWPVSERFASLARVQGIVTDYFTTKGQVALTKFFSRNAQAAYKWVRR